MGKGLYLVSHIWAGPSISSLWVGSVQPKGPKHQNFAKEKKKKTKYLYEDIIKLRKEAQNHMGFLMIVAVGKKVSNFNQELKLTPKNFKKIDHQLLLQDFHLAKETRTFLVKNPEICCWQIEICQWMPIWMDEKIKLLPLGLNQRIRTMTVRRLRTNRLKPGPLVFPPPPSMSFIPRVNLTFVFVAPFPFPFPYSLSLFLC